MTVECLLWVRSQDYFLFCVWSVCVCVCVCACVHAYVCVCVCVCVCGLRVLPNCTGGPYKVITEPCPAGSFWNLNWSSLAYWFQGLLWGNLSFHPIWCVRWYAVMMPLKLKIAASVNCSCTCVLVLCVLFQHSARECQEIFMYCAAYAQTYYSIFFIWFLWFWAPGLVPLDPGQNSMHFPGINELISLTV